MFDYCLSVCFCNILVIVCRVVISENRADSKSHLPRMLSHYFINIVSRDKY